MNVRDSDGWTQFCHNMFVFEFDSKIFLPKTVYTVIQTNTIFSKKCSHLASKIIAKQHSHGYFKVTHFL